MAQDTVNQIGRDMNADRTNFWGCFATDPPLTTDYSKLSGDVYFNITNQIMMMVDSTRTRWVPAGKFLPLHTARSDGGRDAPPVRQVPGAGGSIAWLPNVRGGARRLTSIAQAAPTSEDNAGVYWISLQDDPEMNARLAVQEFNVGVPDAYMIVGWYNGGTNDAIWIVADAAAAANWRMRVTRAGATNDHATAVPVVIGEYIRVKFRRTVAGNLNVYINDVYQVTIPAANLPAAATMMEEYRYTRPVAPAILAELDIDYCETVLNRNMAATP